MLIFNNGNVKALSRYIVFFSVSLFSLNFIISFSVREPNQVTLYSPTAQVLNLCVSLTSKNLACKTFLLRQLLVNGKKKIHPRKKKREPQQKKTQIKNIYIKLMSEIKQDKTNFMQKNWENVIYYQPVRAQIRKKNLQEMRPPTTHHLQRFSFKY